MPSTEELLEILEEQDQKLKEQQQELLEKDLMISETLKAADQLKSQLEEERQSANSSEILLLKEAINGLRKDNQKKSETIKSLNEQIGKLSESDLVLQQNEKLKQQNRELTEKAQNWKAAESQIEHLEQENMELQRKQQDQSHQLRKLQNASEELQQQNERLQQENGKLRQNAEEADHDCEKCGKLTFEQIKGKILQEKLAKLSGEKKAAQIAVQEREEELERYDIALLCMAIYGGIATITAAIYSEAFFCDFKAFFAAIGTFLCMMGKNVLKWANTASQLGYMLPQETAGTILHWILFAVVIIFVLVVLTAICYGVYKLSKAYLRYYGDKISVAALVGSIAIVIFLAEPISRILPAVNLLVVCIILYCYYIDCRIAYDYGEFLGSRSV